MNKEAIMMVNNYGIINLLVSYVKPINLLTINTDSHNHRINDNIIYMLMWICKYLNLCCQVDQNCVLMLLRQSSSGQHGASSNSSTNNLVYDLIECLNLSEVNKLKLRPFYSVLFELLSSFLSMYEDRTIVENCLIIISKCWLIISSYLINDLLGSGDSGDVSGGAAGGVEQRALDHDDARESCASLFENALKFYSIYLAKLSQLSPEMVRSASSNCSHSLQVLCKNIAYLFDSIEISQVNGGRTDMSTTLGGGDESSQRSSLGAVLTRRLIKLFDKYFLVDTNQNLKQIISNIIKGLFTLSNTAKEMAVECENFKFFIEFHS
jgi:hypothetical protein